MVEELHSQLKKELISKTSPLRQMKMIYLIGFRLIDGETKFVLEPCYSELMERGCTLLLDECDLGSNKLLAVQTSP